MDTRDFEQLLPKTEGFILFYGYKSGPTRFFSNFFPSEFTDPKLYQGVEELDKWRDEEGAVRFHHVEQYMHAIKAIIFAGAELVGDLEVVASFITISMLAVGVAVVLYMALHMAMVLQPHVEHRVEGH